MNQLESDIIHFMKKGHRSKLIIDNSSIQKKSIELGVKFDCFAQIETNNGVFSGADGIDSGDTADRDTIFS